MSVYVMLVIRHIRILLKYLRLKPIFYIWSVSMVSMFMDVDLVKRSDSTVTKKFL